MANLLQSSQCQQTTAPSYYTNYLQNLICKGQQAQAGAQYVGATGLQQQAFGSAAQNQGLATPIYQQAQATFGCAANQNIAGAAQPYLQAGTQFGGYQAMQPYAQSAMGRCGTQAAQPYYCRASTFCAVGSASPYLAQAAQSGGLGAANPYIQNAAQTNIQGAAQPYLQQAVACSPAQMAQQYMNPYIQTAAQGMSDIANRNIQQNLAPQATAAAVGSGQFGSQRGAQVLGQVEANALQCLNQNVAQMEATGYNQALCAAKSRSALLGQLGQTAGCLAKSQGALGIQAGQVSGCLAQRQACLQGKLGATAGCLSARQQQNLFGAGSNLGQLTQCAAKVAAGLAGTAGQVQNQYSSNLLNAGNIAACSAARQAAARTQAAQGLSGLGSNVASTNIACINMLANLGEQCRTLLQNQQLFPLQTLGDMSSILSGAQIPMGTTQTMNMSPLSAIGGTLGLLAGAGQNYCNIVKSLGGIGSLFKGLTGQPIFGVCPCYNDQSRNYDPTAGGKVDPTDPGYNYGVG